MRFVPVAFVALACCAAGASAQCPTLAVKTTGAKCKVDINGVINLKVSVKSQTGSASNVVLGVDFPLNDVELVNYNFPTKRGIEPEVISSIIYFNNIQASKMRTTFDLKFRVKNCTNSPLEFRYTTFISDGQAAPTCYMTHNVDQVLIKNAYKQCTNLPAFRQFRSDQSVVMEYEHHCLNGVLQDGAYDLPSCYNRCKNLRATAFTLLDKTDCYCTPSYEECQLVPSYYMDGTTIDRRRLTQKDKHKDASTAIVNHDVTRELQSGGWAPPCRCYSCPDPPGCPCCEEGEYDDDDVTPGCCACQDNGTCYEDPGTYSPPNYGGGGGGNDDDDCDALCAIGITLKILQVIAIL